MNKLNPFERFRPGLERNCIMTEDIGGGGLPFFLLLLLARSFIRVGLFCFLRGLDKGFRVLYKFLCSFNVLKKDGF